jgi:hypothetical protein
MIRTNEGAPADAKNPVEMTRDAHMKEFQSNARVVFKQADGSHNSYLRSLEMC